MFSREEVHSRLPKGVTQSKEPLLLQKAEPFNALRRKYLQTKYSQENEYIFLIVDDYLGVHCSRQDDRAPQAFLTESPPRKLLSPTNP